MDAFHPLRPSPSCSSSSSSSGSSVPNSSQAVTSNLPYTVTDRLLPTSSSSSSSSASIEMVVPLSPHSGIPAAQVSASVLNPDLVARLARRVDSQLPTPSGLRTSEKLPVIEFGLRMMMSFAPPPPDADQLSEDDVLADVAFRCGRSIWSSLAPMLQAPDEAAEAPGVERLMPRMVRPITDYFERHGDFATLRNDLGRAIPREELAQVIPDVVSAFNRENKTDYSTIEEVGRHEGRREFRALAERLLQHSDSSPRFLQKVLMIIGRTQNFMSFAECVSEDVMAGKTVADSLVLQLLDAYIRDFIQLDRKSIWFQSVTNNFGYRRDGQDWERFVGTRTFEHSVIDFHMWLFEKVLDMFNETNPQMPSYAQSVLEIVEHLDWMLSTPMEVLQEHLPSTPPIGGPRYSESQQAFQHAFIAWAIDAIKQTDPKLVDDKVEDQLEHRIWMASQLLPNTPSCGISLIKNRNLAVAIAPLIRNGVVAAQYAAQNLIASREPNGPSLELVLGIGFQGALFSNQPNARHQPTGLLMNVSERGRRIPSLQKMEQSLFSIPFLFATKFLSQKMNQDMTKNPASGEVIPITVLSQPTEADKRVHHYLFDRLLTHAFSYPDIALNPDFLDLKARREIQQTLTTYCAGTLPSQKGLAPAAKREAQQHVRAMADEVGRRIVNESQPQLSPEELKLVLDALANRASICVESVISRHGKNNLIVPISFDPLRGDIVITPDGHQMRVGTRGIIPPCDRYCQLLSGSHQLWADLTRDPTLDQLDEAARQST